MAQGLQAPIKQKLMVNLVKGTFMELGEDFSISNNLKTSKINGVGRNSYIFDLDGVITDTTKFHYSAWAKAFKDLRNLIGKPGIKINENIYNNIIDGAPRCETIKNILMLHGITFSNEDVAAIAYYKNKEYMSLVRKKGVFLYKDAIDLIKGLSQIGAKMGVATSSKNGHEILKMARISHYFDFIASGEEIECLKLKPKPSPDIFNLVIKKLGSDIEDVFILEDSKVGLSSAIATGCKNVIYADRKNLNLNLGFRYRLTNLTDILNIA